MIEPNLSHPFVIEMIPSDCAFAEVYLQRASEQLNDRTDIDVGIADADAGRLISLEAVRAKWLSR